MCSAGFSLIGPVQKKNVWVTVTVSIIIVARLHYNTEIGLVIIDIS